MIKTESLQNKIYQYLQIKNKMVDETITFLINQAIMDLKKKSKFKYIYEVISQEQFYQLKLKNYHDYFKIIANSSKIVIMATTLGLEIDRYIKYLTYHDLSYSIIVDAVASAWLEEEADKYEKEIIANESEKYYSVSKTIRFCPGYQATSLDDNQTIGAFLEINKKLGITFLDSKLMVPQKSLVGFFGL